MKSLCFDFYKRKPTFSAVTELIIKTKTNNKTPLYLKARLTVNGSFRGPDL